MMTGSKVKHTKGRQSCCRATSTSHMCYAFSSNAVPGQDWAGKASHAGVMHNTQVELLIIKMMNE